MPKANRPRKTASYGDFSDSALIGHVVSLMLVTKLMEKKVISQDDAADLIDWSLLRLEEIQSYFPEHQKYFEIARGTLSEFLDAARSMTKRSPE
jgi:hypothetical protein